MIQDILKIADRIFIGVGRVIQDELLIKSNVLLELYGPDGTIKTTRKVHNTVTTAGKNGVAAQCASSPGLAKAGWMEVGTGTTPTTVLQAYISGSRTACSSYTATGAVVTYVCTFGAGVGTGNITECGTFNIVTQNTVDMWMYSTFGVITKGALDSLTVTWTLTVG